MRYLNGTCILEVPGDDYLYQTKPFTYEETLELNTAYIKDGYVYIYRGDVAKMRKYSSGIFTDKKGNVMFTLSDDEKDIYDVANVRDDSISSILEQAKRISPTLKRRIIKDINKSSDIYVPELDENDDFLKHLIKLILLEKKIDLKEHKDKFKKAHDATNLKASLEAKTSSDGKKGNLTMPNLLKWLEILEMKIDVTISDGEHSEDPCFKTFSYKADDGYLVTPIEGYDDIEVVYESELEEEEEE